MGASSAMGGGRTEFSEKPTRSILSGQRFARIENSPVASKVFAAMPRTLFVTTALPYANGPFHIGHIMEYIQADIWVRFQRMLGNVVHFVGADDAHGAPIMLKAEAEGVSPQELVARITADRPRHLL